MVRIILAGMLLAGCGDAQAPQTSESQRVIRIAGSSSVNDKLMPALAAEYQRLHPEVSFEITSGGSGAGMRALLDGEVELAAASRGHTPSEQEQASVNGIDLDAEGVRHVVAVDVVALTVHPDNPLEAMTYDQVIGVYCTHGTDSWDLLGQEERPIRALTRDTSSGTRALFEDFFCGPSGIHDRIEVRSTTEMLSIVREDTSAIAYASMAEEPGKIVGLRPDSQSPAVKPSQANIIRGIYPLYRDLYVYSSPKSMSEDARAFLEFIDSPAGQEIVDEEGFVPLFLRPDRMDGPRPMRETIHFEPHSSQLTTRSQARLKVLAEELKERSSDFRHVVLEGYADSHEEEPERLSSERAAAVEAALKTELPDLFFETIPRGASNPLAPNATPHGRHRNRRVQIYLAEEEVDTPAPTEGE
ncbi:MAG: hypothetical protein EP330_30085 [Deltaproteobacteria bacterium]|nr:MAG: hypothetical protein EP330_30085 [Deltaproteobacteria bacterium]